MDSGSENLRVVVGVDGSGPSQEALRWAARHARLTGAVVEAVCVWETPSEVGWAELRPPRPDSTWRTPGGASPTASRPCSVTPGRLRRARDPGAGRSVGSPGEGVRGRRPAGGRQQGTRSLRAGRAGLRQPAVRSARRVPGGGRQGEGSRAFVRDGPGPTGRAGHPGPGASPAGLRLRDGRAVEIAVDVHHPFDRSGEALGHRYERRVAHLTVEGHPSPGDRYADATPGDREEGAITSCLTSSARSSSVRRKTLSTSIRLTMPLRTPRSSTTGRRLTR